MMRLTCRPVALTLGLLFAALMPVASTRAAPPRGMGGMRGGMMMPAGMSMPRTPPGMGSPFMPMAPAMGMNGIPSNSMPGRAGSGSAGMSLGGMGSGSGYSGGGSGSPSGAPMTSPDLSASYVNPFDSSAFARGQTQNARAGPLLGLLKAEGGLDWPLALRILPPETRDLRQHIDVRAGEVQSQASAGKVDAGLLRDTSRDVEKLREILADRADHLPVSEQAMTDARQFIRKLRNALKTGE
jgi:hypothetical protein